MRLNKNNHFSLMQTINEHMNSEISEKKILEAWWNTPTLSKKDADQLIGEIKKTYKKGGLKGIWDHPQTGERMTLWELIQGLPDFLRTEAPNMIGYVLGEIKDMLSIADRHDTKLKGVFESVIDEEEKKKSMDDIPDREIADMVIRYNQVVNRALRARFMSSTRRKSL